MSTITFANRWQPAPGLTWRAHERTNNIIIDGATKQEVTIEFEKLWADRAPIQWVDAPPPRPRRADDPKPAGAAIVGDTAAAAFHRSVLMAFHSDRQGHRTFTSDEIIATVNRLWNEANAKA